MGTQHLTARSNPNYVWVNLMCKAIRVFPRVVMLSRTDEVRPAFILSNMIVGHIYFPDYWARAGSSVDVL